MKWLIVEDALRDRRGHWLEYVSIFVRGLTALGDEVTVLCDRKAEGFIIELLGASPVLPESIWHRMGLGHCGGMRGCRGMRWRYFSQCGKFSEIPTTNHTKIHERQVTTQVGASGRWLGIFKRVAALV